MYRRVDAIRTKVRLSIFQSSRKKRKHLFEMATKAGKSEKIMFEDWSSRGTTNKLTLCRQAQSFKCPRLIFLLFWAFKNCRKFPLYQFVTHFFIKYCIILQHVGIYTYIYRLATETKITFQTYFFNFSNFLLFITFYYLKI